jgi:diguanylate cyclase (GGDEF)-like protein/PAS domain S-box-containing protein
LTEDPLPATIGSRLAEIVQSIAQVRDTAELMAIVRVAARELSGADGATLVMRDGDCCHYVDEDAIGPLWKGQRFALTACISGWAMLHAEQTIIEDIYADARIPHAAYRPTFVQSLCMTPIGRRAPIGAIGCYWAQAHRTSEVEAKLLQALADATAVGIANLELYRQLTEARHVAEARAEQAQRSEALARATFDHAGAGVAIVGLDGRWLRVNRKLCEIVGYDEAGLLERTFQDITSPADVAGDDEAIRRLLAGAAGVTLEKRYVHRDGHAVWVNLAVELVRTPDGAPDYFVAVIEDIGRRKAAEETLEHERATFLDLANIAAEYFWEIDADFRFKAISPSIAERSGLDYANYIGRTRWELPFVGVSDEAWARHRATLAAHQSFRNFEAAMRNRAGELRWFEIHGAPLRDRVGRFTGYHGVTQDITARKAAETTLRQHAMVFDNSQEGIVITDADGCVVDANASFECITEYRLDEIRGRNLRLLQSGRQDRSFYLNMWQALSEVGSWQGEIWNRRKGGEIYPEWISISAVTDDGGAVIAYVGTSVDISRMNHVRSEMERLAHHDALTGLPNRLLLMSRLEHAIERAARGGMGAVMFLDLDGFKQVNDTRGHKVGDEVLIAVAARIRARLREADTLARLGGDEFVIVLEDIAGVDAAAIVAEQVIRAVAVPLELGGERVELGVSIGIMPFAHADMSAAHGRSEAALSPHGGPAQRAEGASTHAAHGRSEAALSPHGGPAQRAEGASTRAAQLLDGADRALYRAKAAGKGVYRYAEVA